MGELYDLPRGWEWKKLEEIGKLFSGTSAPQSDEYFLNGKYPFVRTKDLGTNGRTDNLIEVNDYINDKCLNDSSLILAKKGTVLFPKSGASIGTNNRAIIGMDAYIVSHLGAFYSKEEVTNKYIYNYFLTIDLLDYCENPSYPSLKISRVKGIDVPLPPLSEQQRIVSKLDLLFQKIDKSIELHQKNMNEADAFMGSVLNEIFGELEEEYGLQSLSTVVKINSGIALPSIFKNIETSEGEYEFFKVAQMNNDNRVMKDAELRFTQLQSQKYKIKLFPKGSILIPKRGGAILTNKKRILERDASYDSNVMGLKADNAILSDEFLFAFLDSINLANFVDTSTIPQINNKHIEMMNISIPPLPIQHKVVDYLDSVSAKMEKVKSIQKEKMERLKSLKSSILDKAFRGEL